MRIDDRIGTIFRTALAAAIISAVSVFPSHAGICVGAGLFLIAPGGALIGADAFLMPRERQAAGAPWIDAPAGSAAKDRRSRGVERA